MPVSGRLWKSSQSDSTRGDGEADVLVDQETTELPITRDISLDAAASAQVGDERVDDAVDGEIVAVLAPCFPFARVGEAVRLPRHREAQRGPVVPRHLRAAYGCLAFTAERQPKAITILSGSG